MIPCVACQILGSGKNLNGATHFYESLHLGGLIVAVCSKHGEMYKMCGYTETTEDKYLLQQLKLNL